LPFFSFFCFFSEVVTLHPFVNYNAKNTRQTE